MPIYFFEFSSLVAFCVVVMDLVSVWLAAGTDTCAALMADGNAEIGRGSRQHSGQSVTVSA